MLTARSLVRLLAGLLLLALLVSPAAASAAGPSTVTVRVLGSPPAYETILPITTVTTNEEPVVNDGVPAHSCSGTSAAGALQLATEGHWQGEWSTEFGQYFLQSIDTLQPTTPNYWAFWIDDAAASQGICGQQLSTGDQLLFFPECYEEKVGDCTSQPPNVLAVEAPETVEVKKPVTITVVVYPNAGCKVGTECPTPAAGVNVTGGDQFETTDSEGHVTMSFGVDSTYRLRASKPEGEHPETPDVPAESTVCAHEGDDGTCGTKQALGTTLFPPPPSSSLPGGSQTQLPGLAKSESTILVSATGLIHGHHYSRKQAPRTLSGVIFSTASVTSISMRLSRTFKKRCFDYDGVSTRFEHVHCGKQARYFKIRHSGSTFSYLLPSRLQPGRYVFDVKAADSAGDHTTSKGGSTRIVFYVK